jgi:hypothetical protein
MKPAKWIGFGALALFFSATAAFSQQAISARSGMIHYVEGKVFTGNEQLDGKFGTQVKGNQVVGPRKAVPRCCSPPVSFCAPARTARFA